MHIQRGLVDIDLPVLHPDAVFEQLHELRSRLPVQLQAHHRQTGPLFQQLAHLAAKILPGVLQQLAVKAQIRIPGGTEDTGVLQPVAAEEGRSLLLHDRFHPDKAARVVRHVQERGQAGGDRHQAQRGVALFASQQSGHIEGLVGQVGEGVVAVHDLGGQHGQDAGLIVGADIALFLRRQLLHRQVADAVLPQQRRHVGVQPVFDLNEAGDNAVHLLQLLHGGLPGLVVDVIRRDQAQVEEVAHPDHEEFVQIAGEDGDEFQPFQQRHTLVPRLLQDPPVEAEPAQLAVLGVCVFFLFPFRHCRFLPILSAARRGPPVDILPVFSDYTMPSRTLQDTLHDKKLSGQKKAAHFSRFLRLRE